MRLRVDPADESIDLRIRSHTRQGAHGPLGPVVPRDLASNEDLSRHIEAEFRVVGRHRRCARPEGGVEPFDAELVQVVTHGGQDPHRQESGGGPDSSFSGRVHALTSSRRQQQQTDRPSAGHEVFSTQACRMSRRLPCMRRLETRGRARSEQAYLSIFRDRGPCVRRDCAPADSPRIFGSRAID